MDRERKRAAYLLKAAGGRKCVLTCILSCAMACTVGLSSAEIPDGTLKVILEDVADGLAAPVSLTHAGDASGRLFVADQAGKIHVIKDRQLLLTPFLDLTAKIVTVNAGYDERGVLGLAFHPDYASNGRFFVRYSAPREGAEDEPCNNPEGFVVGCHKEVLAEYHVSANDPDVADPASEVILFEVDKPQFNHNGGHVAFGPDGYLYFGLGDGGGANDGLADTPPSHGSVGNGQSIDTPLGKLLRVDVDGAPPVQAPPDNPFVGTDGLDSIYAYGFRNPYLFSFDRATGELLLADVGQNLFEELNVIVKGGNYGWVLREGAHCFDPFNPGASPDSCPTEGLIDPIAEYDHSQGIAIVGGYAYRGDSYPQFLGRYIFGDFSLSFAEPAGRLFYTNLEGDRSRIFELQVDPSSAVPPLFVKGFGEGEDGEIYLLASTALGPTGTTGKVFHISGALPFRRGDSNADGEVDLSDAVHTLGVLFLGDSTGLSCEDAGDSNADGELDITDPIYTLGYLFLGEEQLPAPGPSACGIPAAYLLGCESYPASCGSPPQIVEAPTADPTTVQEGAQASLSVTASDPDGDSISYSWTQEAPPTPEGSFDDAGAQSPTWTAPLVTADTDFTLRVVVSDGKGGEEQGEVVVTVTDAESPPLFSTDIQPVFTNNCSCHMGPFPSAGMNLGAGQSYANLVNVDAIACSPLKRVLPGDPDSSVLVRKISGSTCGSRMPQTDPGFFDRNADLLARIRAWIEAGAVDG